MTLEEIDAGISALTTALATGEQRVRFADSREVLYKTTGDIVAALKQMRVERATVVEGVAVPGTRLRSWPIVMRR